MSQRSGHVDKVKNTITPFNSFKIMCASFAMRFIVIPVFISF